MKVLLTGATSGIGFEVLKHLVNGDNDVFAVGRDFSKVDYFFRENTTKAKAVVFDLSDVNNIENLFSIFDTTESKFDAMIHCAGIEETLPLSLNTPEKVRDIFNLNIFASIELLRHFTKKKNCVDGASVVFLSSVMAVLGQPGKVGYCATKSAITGLIKSSALEFAKRKIRINAVLPGVVKTPMTDKLFSLLTPENVKKIEDMHPLGFGNVDDIVPAILFLISRDSKWITGQNIIIDGGYSVQ